MNLDFGNILTRAGRIIWNNKILWLFGILAGLGGGRGGFNFNFGGGGAPDISDPRNPNLPPEMERLMERMVEDGAFLAILIGVMCAVLLLALVFFLLSIIGRGGLIGGVQLADRNGAVSFGEAWALGQQNFLNIFLIGLLVGIISLVIGGVLFIPAIICFPLLCLFIPIGIALSAFATLSQIAVVTDGLGVTDAMGRAWQVIQANLGAVLILAIILGVISTIFGFVAVAPLLVAVVPAIAAAAGFANESQAIGTTGLILAGVCVVAYLPILIVVNGILESWMTAAWTLAYQQLTRPAAAPGLAPSASPM
jgi:hypothetical protein